MQPMASLELSVQDRSHLLLHFQEYRIIQPKVVFLHGLPKHLSHPDVLIREMIKFGNVNKVNVQKIGKNFYSGFLEYEKQYDAAAAILSLNEQIIGDRTLRVFYGSTKFCPHFLKNHECRVPNCNYAHYYHPFLTHLKENAKHINHVQIARIQIVGSFQNQSQMQKQYCMMYDQNKNQMRQVEADQTDTETNGEHPNLQISMQNKENSKDDWIQIGSQINQFTQLTMEQQKSKGKLTKIQQFLDEAERLLTKLIFQSSQFVY